MVWDIRVSFFLSFVQCALILNLAPEVVSSDGDEGAMESIGHLHRYLCSAQFFKVLGIQDKEEVAFLLKKETQY